MPRVLVGYGTQSQLSHKCLKCQRIDFRVNVSETIITDYLSWERKFDLMLHSWARQLKTPSRMGAGWEVNSPRHTLGQ